MRGAVEMLLAILYGVAIGRLLADLYWHFRGPKEQ